VKLSELRVREPVDFGSAGTLTHLRAEVGFDMTLEQGTVTIVKGAHVRVLPWAACSFGVPMPAVKKSG
jgi:hypothetical protein